MIFEGSEKIIQYGVIKAEDGRHIPVRLTAFKSDPGNEEADQFKIDIDGVVWCVCDNVTHSIIIFKMLKDRVTDFMHYVTTAGEYYYFFDCLDGQLGDKYLTSSEINMLMTGKSDDLPENDIIQIARNYEATLYRSMKGPEGDYINEVLLYDADL